MPYHNPKSFFLGFQREAPGTRGKAEQPGREGAAMLILSIFLGEGEMINIRGMF